MAELEPFRASEDTVPAIGSASVGWYGVNDDGLAVIGPYQSLEELEAAILTSGHTLPDDHFR